MCLNTCAEIRETGSQATRTIQSTMGWTTVNSCMVKSGCPGMHSEGKTNGLVARFVSASWPMFSGHIWDSCDRLKADVIPAVRDIRCHV